MKLGVFILSDFFNLPPEQFTIIASLFGVLLSEGLSMDQQNSLGNFLSTVGQTMMTVAAQQELLENSSKE